MREKVFVQRLEKIRRLKDKEANSFYFNAF